MSRSWVQLKPEVGETQLELPHKGVSGTFQTTIDSRTGRWPIRGRASKTFFPCAIFSVPINGKDIGIPTLGFFFSFSDCCSKFIPVFFRCFPVCQKIEKRHFVSVFPAFRNIEYREYTIKIETDVHSFPRSEKEKRTHRMATILNEFENGTFLQDFAYLVLVYSLPCLGLACRFFFSVCP